ncbi:hypothetical protein HMPREF0731_3448 [Pseudoroseomonas cervicalis ATCC 49957]|uniref:MoeA N-terminal and linker domain-containing protein n=1 Tax=Pseudoroseomonas cervicalis ATCC 49957 TaxID=525371 RepID=D5RQT6_9PROT|nr:hypothetical protein HMPREF0731_3448 [Pseudoroseomonas cervicalis ATCC 49957]
MLVDPVLATYDMPPFDRAAVDRYGVGGAGPGPLRLVGHLPAGTIRFLLVGAGGAVRLLTGAAVPEGLWAVAMQEGCRVDPHPGAGPRTVMQGANIGRLAEDFWMGTAGGWDRGRVPALRRYPERLGSARAARREACGQIWPIPNWQVLEPDLA